MSAVDGEEFDIDKRLLLDAVELSRESDVEHAADAAADEPTAADSENTG